MKKKIKVLEKPFFTILYIISLINTKMLDYYPKFDLIYRK